MSRARTPGWSRDEAARPLVAWREAQLAELAGVLQRAQEAWSEAWGLPPGNAAVTCVHAAKEDREAGWHALGEGPAPALWIALPESFEDALARGLWGGGSPVGPIARELAVACRADFASRLLALVPSGTLGRAPGGPVPECSAWSGLVRATLAAGVRLLLDAAAVGSLLRAHAPSVAVAGAPSVGRPALVPLAEALAGLRLPLRAQLADFELGLADLQGLRVGDVLPLPHRLDAPLTVRNAQGDTLCGAHLARRGRFKALELAAVAATGAQPL